MMINIIGDLGYTGKGQKSPKGKTYSTKTFPKIVEEIQNKTFDEIIDRSDDLQEEGLKTIIPSNIIDIYSRM